jgi:aminobenzoyl-glutamate utilization protein B
MHPETTIEYVITEGGSQPNVVPSVSKVWFFIRHPNVENVKKAYEKIQSAAEGAATATDTTLEEQFITGCYPYLMNETIARTMYENAVDIGPPSYTESEREFAQNLIDSYDIEADEPISEVVTLETGDTYLASQDDGDTSWIVPMGRFHFPYPNELPLHTWGATATSGSSIGFRGMVYNAKTLACTALDVITNPDLLDEITEEFEVATDDFEYECLVPDTVDPISAEWVEKRLGD